MPAAPLEPFGPSKPPPNWRRLALSLVSGVVLLVSIVVVVATIRRARSVEHLNAPPAFSPITDPAVRSARLRDVADVFATGSNPGDRLLTIRADGVVRFSIIGPDTAGFELTDAFTLGRRDRAICLVTHESGVIDVVDIDTLRFCDDLYRRVKRAAP